MQSKWFIVLATAAILVVLLTASALASYSGENNVTDEAYTRHDGVADPVITHCSSNDTTVGPGGDGGGNRQQNEPTVAINPDNPDIITAGANDYCTVGAFGDAWMGFYVSVDGGDSWFNSLLPGYPGDTSVDGLASPLQGLNTAAGDPIMDWDNDGHLFYGGISFNRTVSRGAATPTNGHVIVSTWEYVGVSGANPLGMDYIRTVIVGEGTPSTDFWGRFNDKPNLRVDDWGTSPYEGNVYVSWTLFPGGGMDQILFSRSTDGGETFSHPIKISHDIANAQGSDIAVAPNGDVYVAWRQFAFLKPGVVNAIMYVKSTDGGQTFSSPQMIALVEPYDRRDTYATGGTARDCGDGPFLCASNFVFHRGGTSEPQLVADEDGIVYATWEEVVPAANNSDTYRPDGRARVVYSMSSNGGATWTSPAAIDDDPGAHQWWANIEYDRTTDTLVVIYYGSGGADDSFSVNRPPGNDAAGLSTCGVPAPALCEILNAWVATYSGDPPVAWSSNIVSTVGHQPEYEMFGNRNVPFHGDYLWIDANGGNYYGVWTDNRDVVPGSDPRETVQDGFDVWQCRVLSAGTWSADNCPNAGGLNQNIYGFGDTLP